MQGSYMRETVILTEEHKNDLSKRRDVIRYGEKT